jgi:hypothetical protein
METQNKMILQHLRVKPITPIEALDLYGCFRLAARIRDLKELGHAVNTELVAEGNRRFARYTLISEA